jgi:hypothetical protein
LIVDVVGKTARSIDPFKGSFCQHVNQYDRLFFRWDFGGYLRCNLKNLCFHRQESVAILQREYPLLFSAPQFRCQFSELWQLTLPLRQYFLYQRGRLKTAWSVKTLIRRSSVEGDPSATLRHSPRQWNKAFYKKLGFIACMDSPLSLYLPVATLEQANTP